MCSFKSIYFVLFYLVLNNSKAQISDKRLCVDPNCSEPVSFAKTLLKYSSIDPRILSFTPNQDVIIFSKDAGSNTDLWGAEIKGKRGYVPKVYVRENRLLNKPKFLIDTELEKPEVPNKTKEQINPDSVKEAYEIIDGTTIFLGPQEVKSDAENEGQNTALPDNNDKEEVNEPEIQKTESSTPASQVTETPSINSETESLEDDEDVSVEDDDDGSDDDDESDEDNDDDEEEQNNENQSNSTEQSVTETIPTSSENLEAVKEAPVTELNESVEVRAQGKLPSQEEPPIPNLNEQEISDQIMSSSSEEKLETNSAEVVREVSNTALPDQIKNSFSEEKLETNSAEVLTEVKENSLPDLNKTSSSEENVEINSAEVLTEVNGNVVPDQIKTSSSEEKLETDSAEVLTEVNDIALPEVVPAAPGFFSNIIGEGIKIATYSSNVEEPVIKSDTISNSEKSELNPEALEKTVVNPEALPENTPPVETVDDSVDTDSKESFLPNADPAKEIVEEKSEEVVLKINTEIPEQIAIDNIKKDDSAEVTEQPANASGENVSTEIPFSSAEEDSNEVPSPLPVTTESSMLLDDTIANNEFEFVTPDPLTSDNGASSEADISDSSHESILEAKPDLPLPPSAIIGNIQDALNEQEVNIPHHPLFASHKQLDTIVENNIESKTLPEIPTQQPVIQPEVVEQSETLDMNTEKINPNINNQQEQNNLLNTNPISDKNDDNEKSEGFFSGLFGFFSSSSTEETNESDEINQSEETNQSEESNLPTEAKILPPHEPNYNSDFCYGDNCRESAAEEITQDSCNDSSNSFNLFNFNADVLMYLATTAVSVIIFLFGYMAMDKSKRESPLVARINKLEKELLVTLKENELLQEQGGMQIIENEAPVSNEFVDKLTEELNLLRDCKQALEDQVQALEKELDTSTEVGMELNRIVSEMLNSSNGSETLKANVEQLQRQLVEQQDTINTVNETLTLKETENIELNLELDITNKKVVGLQSELDSMVEKILKIEEERDLQQNSLESEITLYQQKHKDALLQIDALNNEQQSLKSQVVDANRNADLKVKEYNVLKKSLDQIKSMKKSDGDTIKSLLEVTEIKAELEQLKIDNHELSDKLSHEEVAKINLEKQIESIKEECELLKEKYEAADKEKLESNTRLDVLNNYFKEKEAQLQKEISKYESIWATKEGEATSSTERLKYVQEELQNYKTQNETLKQEIVNQEVALKGQISVLEKKIHENWVTARQADRKLEEAKQEAAQLRNRLTLRERALTEEKAQNRLQSPMELNGEHPLSPQPIQSPASPPLLYGARDLTKSPPMPGLPFLPPPPGAPFMPPPIPGMPPFMPPPPSMFPDHRPPPLGRMSSPPPLNSRYSPESTIYSGYDRNSPSPTYDSEYGTSPAMRAYSPYNNRRDDRRDYKRQSHKVNGRHTKGSGISSGSDHSHESLGKSNRKHGKV